MREFVQIERITRSEFRDSISSRELTARRVPFEAQVPTSMLSPYLVARLITIRSTPIPECVKCGVCCVIPLVVTVSAREAERLTNYTEIVLDSVDEEIVVGRVIPRRETGECVNLNGTIGVEVKCSAYQERPQCCRDFEAGSDRCHEFRRMYGLEPQLTETEVESAMSILRAQVTANVIKDVSIVRAGTTVRMAISTDDEPVESSESLMLKIFVLLNDDSEHELDTYDPAREEWLETDFLGMSLDEARERIREKSL